MGGLQAADVLYTIKLDKNKDSRIATNDIELEKIRKPILEKYEAEGHPYYSSARIWDDGIISPADTRTILIQARRVIKTNPKAVINSPVFRM